MSTLSPNYLPTYYVQKRAKKGVKLEQQTLLNKRRFDHLKAIGELPKTALWPYQAHGEYIKPRYGNHGQQSAARYAKRHQKKIH